MYRGRGFPVARPAVDEREAYYGRERAMYERERGGFERPPFYDERVPVPDEMAYQKVTERKNHQNPSSCLAATRVD